MIEFAKIVVLGVVAAVCYGVLHDQVTARVCVEYFTIGHPPIFGTDSRTLLAIGWGVLGTWRLGVMLGLVTAAFARLGSRPGISARQLIGPVAVLIGCVALLSLVFGIAGFLALSRGLTSLDATLASGVPESVHPRFAADLWSHRAAYMSSYFGSVVLWARIARCRRRLASERARRSQ